MKPIDTIFHAVAQAQAERVNLDHLVVTAWLQSELKILAADVVRALGVTKPDTDLDDILPMAKIGSVVALALDSCAGNGAVIDESDMEDVVDEYVALIKRAARTIDPRFLQQAGRHVRAAIELSISARLNCISLEERYKNAPIDQALSFCVEVDAYLRDYKQQTERVDVADLLAGEFNPDNDCKLCLLNRRGVPPLGIQALRRILPNAFVVNLSL